MRKTMASHLDFEVAVKLFLQKQVGVLFFGIEGIE
jgi:hypothetical protein